MGTALAYEFEFVLTETNDAQVGGSVTVPISLGSFILGYSAGGTKSRQATQKVKFADLFSEIMQLKCEGHLPRRNLAYPITGEIGLYPTFNNFHWLATWQRGDELEIFTDEIKFTTTLTAGVKPQIELTPSVGRKVSVTGDFKATRTDVHRLTLSFDAPTTPEQKTDKRNAALAALQFDRGVPYRVQLVDKDGKIIAIPGAEFAPPIAASPTGKGSRIVRPPAPAMSTLERKQRALQKLDDSRTQILQRRLLERLE